MDSVHGRFDRLVRPGRWTSTQRENHGIDPRSKGYIGMPRPGASPVTGESDGQVWVIAVRSETGPLAGDLAVARAPESRQAGRVDGAVRAGINGAAEVQAL